MRDSRVANALPNLPAPRVGGGRTETPFGSGTGSVHQSRSALFIALGLCHWRQWLTCPFYSLGRPQAGLAAVPALVEPVELAAAALAFPRPPLGVASPYPHTASFRLSRASFLLLSCYVSACSLACRSVQTRRPSFPSPRRVALLAALSCLSPLPPASDTYLASSRSDCCILLYVRWTLFPSVLHGGRYSEVRESRRSWVPASGLRLLFLRQAVRGEY